jgi:2,5-dioxopentanoate dehydrogenase
MDGEMLTGHSIIAGKSKPGCDGTFTGVDPATGTKLEPAYSSASLEDLDLAVSLAEKAFTVYGRTSGSGRAHFLRHAAEGLEGIAAEIIDRANKETGLPEARLKGELARTVNQFRMFAQLIEEGSWVNARIDPALPERKPQQRADIRSVLRPLGPVAVFGASNFPLAFSVAGGDTASALAAGNPVVVKAHPAHPGTSELVGQVVSRSVRACELPAGVFALLFDSGVQLGSVLVAHPAIKAVGFTGSLAGGRALMQIAAARPEPIPCFMEMGSINPFIVLPGALKTRAAEIANGLFNSFTLGVGQMCTKPGLIYLPRDNEDVDKLVTELKVRVEQAGASVMLTDAICRNHLTGMILRQSSEHIETVALSEAHTGAGGAHAAPALFQTNGSDMLEDSELAKEIFGPSTLIIRYKDTDELTALAEALEGQLTASVHGSDAEIATNADLIATLERKAGRLIMNGYPTGVEVCHAMIHGGPYPATSDGRSTSVGSLAIYRFARPVCYQNFPQVALPDELKDENPLGILRLIDGQFTRDAVRAEELAPGG